LQGEFRRVLENRSGATFKTGPTVNTVLAINQFPIGTEDMLGLVAPAIETGASLFLG
jgi:hypothetical protein